MPRGKSHPGSFDSKLKTQSAYTQCWSGACLALRGDTVSLSLKRPFYRDLWVRDLWEILLPDPNDKGQKVSKRKLSKVAQACNPRAFKVEAERLGRS